MIRITLACILTFVFCACATPVSERCPSSAEKCDDVLGQPKAVLDLSEKMVASRRIRYFNGYFEERMTGFSLKARQTYTVLVIGDQLILGEGFKNGDGSFGKTHAMLAQAAHLQLIFTNKGGAIRVNADGSIDVSGFHNKKPDPESSALIEKILRGKAPAVRLRVTPDRLNTL